MSTTSQTYSEFKDVTDLFMQLNQALITAKRVCFGDKSQPTQAEQESAKKVLAGLLNDVKRGLTGEPEELSGALRKLIDTVRNGRLPTGKPASQAIDSCISNLNKGLGLLGRDDLDFLDRFTSALDKSSENLYRQVARL
jgi:hypothetical protein